MGERFSHFRVAWGDTWEAPVRGLPFGERRRLDKLAQSGRRIADPQDAEHVRDFVAWNLRVIRRVVVVYSLFFVAFGTIDGLFLLGHPRRRLLWEAGVLAVAYVICLLLCFYGRHRLVRTSRANGWAL